VLHTRGDAVVGRTRNVSRGGLCATLGKAFDAGAELELDLHLVFVGDQQSEALRLPARIVWCTSVDDGYQIGLVFLPLAPEVAADLTMFLSYLDDGDRAQPRRESIAVDDRFG
jgi:hypothetical protein